MGRVCRSQNFVGAQRSLAEPAACLAYQLACAGALWCAVLMLGAACLHLSTMVHGVVHKLIFFSSVRLPKLHIYVS